jgi:hypothetical protein
MEQHRTFWKAEKVVKEKKQWQPGKKPKKEIAPWRQDILSSHTSNPSRADRADFPREVIKQLIERAGGKCEVCRSNTDTETHHIQPRGRSGRGVFQNGLRVCFVCHQSIQTNEDELNYWINRQIELYGDRFWYDQTDLEEFNRKQAANREIHESQKHRIESLEPIVDLLTAAAGRMLKAKEMRLLDGLDEREIAVFAKLMYDVVGSGIVTTTEPEFGYGKFND